MAHTSRQFFFCLAITLSFSTASAAEDCASEKKPAFSIRIKSAADIAPAVARMTLLEKLGQLVQTDIAVADPEDFQRHCLGSLISLIPDGSLGAPSAWRAMADRYQQEAIKTRTGIPAVFAIDAVHGHSYFDGPSVILPHNIGIGASRNPELAARLAEVTAMELRATGVRWTFSPSIAVARNIRWGRTYESFGEDVSLQRLFAAPIVKALQTGPHAVGATAKHFVADGATDNGIDRGNATLSEAALRAMHMPGFKDAIAEGVVSVMASFSSVNGEKVHGSRRLLTELLKEELGFDGVVVTDWEGVKLSGLSLEQGLMAGIDMFMFAESWKTSLPELIDAARSGRVPMSRIDDAVARVLLLKLRVGLFDQPFTTTQFDKALGSGAHRDIARQAVRESLVLLKNEDSLLPLHPSEPVHVTGTHADNVAYQSGGWTKKWQGAHLDLYGHAAREIEGATSILAGFKEIGQESIVAADQADTVVLVVGETPYAEMIGDRKASELVLPDTVISEITRYKAAGKRVVTVLITGRPLLLEDVLTQSDAVVVAWLPGSEGKGVAEVLYGQFNFTGQLGFSWPGNASQIPINIGDQPYEPLFSFGFGLRYPE